MYLRKCHREVDGKRYRYWALVECYRTERGPRQRVVAHLGEMDEQGRVGVWEAAEGKSRGRQGSLFEEKGEPQWVEVDINGIRVERVRRFGGPWLAYECLRKLGLMEFLAEVMPRGVEELPWHSVALILVIMRLCDPSSELHLAEHGYEQTALEDLLGVPAEKVNAERSLIRDDRLYRALDQLLPHKEQLEGYLKERLGELFGLTYDLLLYDVTSTYFEGEMKANAQAQRGYSRDHRPDCKQVCLALVVSRCGMPLGYEVFAGNRSDVTTMREMVEKMEARYGQADRIWIMDRGMVSEANLLWLRGGGRRYIVGTPRSQLNAFAQELAEGNWEKVREGLEVKLCPRSEGEEMFILCRSAQRQAKEASIHQRFQSRIEAGLDRIAQSCRKRKQDRLVIARRVGRLLARNTRAAKRFQVEIRERQAGGAELVWQPVPSQREWDDRSEGCYLLRSNVPGWSGKDYWETYIQLVEAEAAFRIEKSDLRIRPIWHQKQKRVQAHILVCFLSYVLWKTLARWCHASGLGDEPRKVLEEIAHLQQVDVVLPTKSGRAIRKRCIARPTQHQSILLQRLGLKLPAHINDANL